MRLKKFRLPHTLVLIYAMVVLTVIATWVVPGGEYQRIEKEGRTIPVSGSFQFADKQPQGLGALFVSPIKGFIEAAYIIVFIFVVGGAFAIIQRTGAITAFIHNLALKFGGSKTLQILLIPIMAPLGDLVGITRQTTVFAFQLAEYINPVLPTSGVTMGVLGLARLRWAKWAKWLIPLLVLWVLFGLISLIPPVLMHWGPN